MAKILQTNETTIYNWEKNRTTPELIFLPRIIQFLGYAPYFGPCRSLGEKIMRYRQYLGLSQKVMSKQIGIDPGTLERWENCKSKSMGKKVEKLNNFFLHYLLGKYEKCDFDSKPGRSTR
jgi:DNA-binding XRE family transcriptional regulator